MERSSTNGSNDSSEDLARWLQEVGRRTVARARAKAELQAEPPEVLLAHLEALSGRRLATRNDLDHLLAELWNQFLERDRSAERLRIIREASLLTFLIAAYLHYEYWNVSLQIAALRSVQVFVPVNSDPAKMSPYRPSGAFASSKG